MMETHVCGNRESRHWRLIMALANRDEDAYWLTWNEIHDCPDCLRDALEWALHLYAGDFVRQAGGLDKAANAAATEVARMQGMMT